MPGPDPKGVRMEKLEGGGFRLIAELWKFGNPRARNARMHAIYRNLRSGNWLCVWCKRPVPLSRRSDAIYCRESCRKVAARQRRSERRQRVVNSGNGEFGPRPK